MAKQGTAAADPLKQAYFPDGALDKQDFKRLWFDDLNARKRELTDCDLSYSVFERGYFRDAVFTRCKFVGARFYDCNFRGATFVQCEFQYADFHRTLVNAEDIIPNLPLAPNQRRDLLQNLRVNAASIGDHEATRLYVLEEMEASLEHYKKAVRGKESYYREKYKGFWSKLGALWRLTLLRLDAWIWGHGERPLQIFVSTGVVLLLLAIINLIPLSAQYDVHELSWGLRSLEYIIRLFLDIGANPAFHGWSFIDYLVGAYRYLFFGLAASILLKIGSHR